MVFWVPGECSCVIPARAQRSLRWFGVFEEFEDLCCTGKQSFIVLLFRAMASENLFLGVKLDLQNIPFAVNMIV